jgi:NhaP-type Na+/H+ and K+/H+ antiporter
MSRVILSSLISKGSTNELAKRLFTNVSQMIWPVCELGIDVMGESEREFISKTILKLFY